MRWNPCITTLLLWEEIVGSLTAGNEEKAVCYLLQNRPFKSSHSGPIYRLISWPTEWLFPLSSVLYLFNKTIYIILAEIEQNSNTVQCIKTNTSAQCCVFDRPNPSECRPPTRHKSCRAARCVWCWCGSCDGWCSGQSAEFMTGHYVAYWSFPIKKAREEPICSVAHTFPKYVFVKTAEWDAHLGHSPSLLWPFVFTNPHWSSFPSVSICMQRKLERLPLLLGTSPLQWVSSRSWVSDTTWSTVWPLCFLCFTLSVTEVEDMN